MPLETEMETRPVDESTAAEARSLILAGLGERFGFIDDPVALRFD